MKVNLYAMLKFVYSIYEDENGISFQKLPIPGWAGGVLGGGYTLFFHCYVMQYDG